MQRPFQFQGAHSGGPSVWGQSGACAGGSRPPAWQTGAVSSSMPGAPPVQQRPFGMGVQQSPYLNGAGKGVQQRPHLKGLVQSPYLNAAGKGAQQRPYLNGAGKGAQQSPYLNQGNGFAGGGVQAASPRPITNGAWGQPAVPQLQQQPPASFPPITAAPPPEADGDGTWKQDSWSQSDDTSSWKKDDADEHWKKDNSDGDWKKDSWSDNDSNSKKKLSGWERARMKEWQAEEREKEHEQLVEEEAKWEAVDTGPAQANSSWAFIKGDAVDLEVSVPSRRAELEISVQGEAEGVSIAPFSAFSNLGGVIPEYVNTALGEAGMTAPMPIQAQAWPIVLRGFDLIGIAKTGSGKTMAFVLPAIAHIEAQQPISAGEKTPMALVLCPVRELAVQIAEEANKLLWKSNTGNHPEGIGAVALYGGGMRIRSQQISEMNRGWCQLVVATPGRAVDLLGADELAVNRVTYFVLDEADRMLEGGFEEQMNQIAAGVRPDRQTLFFSATWPIQVRKLARNMCKNQPMRVTVGQVETGNGPTARGDIVQEVVVLDGEDSWQDVEKHKLEMLYTHLRKELQVEESKILVFVNMKNLAWELAEKLGEEGFSCDFMYGGRSQDARHEVIAKFKAGTTKLLVTTDVMARGLDIPGISHVVIFDMYGGIEEYVHRIGRTCRGLDGRGGHALSFFEYDQKFPDMAAELIGVLESAGQVVPPALQKIADEVASGIRSKKKQKWKY